MSVTALNAIFNRRYFTTAGTVIRLRVKNTVFRRGGSWKCIKKKQS
jgi:hypothetical protein